MRTVVLGSVLLLQIAVKTDLGLSLLRPLRLLTGGGELALPL